MHMTKLYKGKYFSVLGDSVSTLAGYNPDGYEVFYNWEKKRLADIRSPADTWWGYVIDALAGQMLVNASWSGSLVCKHPQSEIESYGCSTARTSALSEGGREPDVVMVFMGLNDFGHAMRPLPVPGKDGLDVFSVAYGVMLEKIRANYPNSEIWCFTLPTGFERGNGRKASPVCCGYHIDEYSRVIESCAESAGCRTVRLHLFDAYESLDGWHPTANGMQTIARAVLECVKEWCADDN